ncbi:MAG: PAS domain S-box protein [Methanomassiliicoccales archaeon]|nr:PAS domain S-box protein [Methanomassiliicoccales archaeon]
MDDDIAIQELAMLFIEKEGISRVDTSTSAEAALFTLDAQSYDAIVSDYQMPGMDGIKFLKALRGKGDNTPFILFTGRGREEVVIEALNSGADFYLQKGGDPRSQFAELTNMIRRLVSQRRSQMALRESEQRYRSFVQNFKGIAFRGRFDFTPVFFHGEWESITGYSDEELRSGQVKWNQIVHPDDIPRYKENGPNLREIPGFSLEREYRIVRKDGDVRWVQEVVTNVLDECGKPEAVEGVIHDITDRKTAEEAVVHNLLHFKALIENVSDIIAVVDQSGVLQYVSPSVTRILGYEEKDAISRSVFDLIHPDDAERLAGSILRVVSNERQSKFSEFRLRTKGGDWVVLEATGTVSDGFTGGARVIVTARDVTERKRIEDALIASEQAFHNFIDRACDGITILQNSELKYLNASLAKMLMFSVEELLGKPFMDHIWPDEVPKIEERYKRRMAGENIPSIYETALKRKDGTKLEVEINAGLIEYDGDPADLVIIREIGERKDAEKALKESETRYRAIFENTGTATILVEDDMTILLANEEFERLSGFSKSEVEGILKWTQFASKKDLKRLSEYHRLRRIDPKAAPNEFEFTFVDRDGHEHSISATVDIIPGTKMSIKSYRDITDLKIAQATLQKEKEERQTLLDNIETMVWYATDPETYGSFNRARAEFLGKTKEELEGKKLREVNSIPEEYRNCLASNTEAFSKKKTVHVEEWITTSKGDRRLVAITKTPMLDEKGKVKFLVCSGIDVTEGRRKEEELKLAAKKLNLSGSLLRHDIMNQLSVIMGYAGMAAEQIKNPRLLRYVSRIEMASKAIKKALEFAKEYQEVGTKAPVWKNLKDSLKEGLVGLNLVDVSLFTDLDDVEVFADPMLDRVFYNLIDNACRHGDDLKSISISCKRSGDNLKLICEDDGIGIPEDRRERLFSEGHGLQMVRDILMMTGITITEKGKKGKGAKFEIVIPQGNFRFLN